MTIPRNTLVAIAITAAAFALPAAAATATNTQTIDVKIAGLDLNTPAGAELVLGKIERAAKRVCAIGTARETLAGKIEAEACVEKAVKVAVASIDAPVLKQALAFKS